MNSRKRVGMLLLLAPVLIAVLVLNNYLPSKAEYRGLPKVVFYVS